MAGLPGRLLSVFLDLPGAALYTRIKATADAAHTRSRAATERSVSIAQATAVATAAARRSQLDALEQAQAALAELARHSSAPSASEAAAEVARLASALADAEDAWAGTNRDYRRARAARQADEKALNDHRESALAWALFHGLDPATCPRCETPVAAERKAREAEQHQCAVCTAPLPLLAAPAVGAAESGSGVGGAVGNGVDGASELRADADGPDEAGEASDEVEAELNAAWQASSAAELAARSALEGAEADTAGLTAQLQGAEETLRQARDAVDTRERAALELSVARAEGALSVLPSEDTAAGSPVDVDADALVLAALTEELKLDLNAQARRALDALGAEIVILAHEFGISSITDVQVDRRAALKITKGGASASSFSAQSPGERLRLRLATILALLRVGQRLGIATHPGLLMLDSLKAEEVQDSDARTVLRALTQAAMQTPGLQIITTSADETLPVGHLDPQAIIKPLAGASTVW